MRTVRTGILLAATLVALSVPAPGRGALPFIEEDYGRALAQARSRGLPLFVEAWAPW